MHVYSRAARFIRVKKSSWVIFAVEKKGKDENYQRLYNLVVDTQMLYVISRKAFGGTNQYFVLLNFILA